MKRIMLLCVGLSCSAIADEGVVINGQRLSAADSSSLESVYNIAAVPGRYWCDPVSGLWGLEGRPAAGILSPSNCRGTLQPAASAGSSGVYLNGRELQQSEARYWARQLGADLAQPGHYELTSSGTLRGVNAATGTAFAVDLFDRDGRTGNTLYRSQTTHIGNSSPGDCQSGVGAAFSYSITECGS